MYQSIATFLKKILPRPIVELLRSLKIAPRVLFELSAAKEGTAAEKIAAFFLIIRARKQSLISVPWLVWMWQFALSTDRLGIAGDFVECGVYNGGSAMVQAHVLTRSRARRQLWLFDSFVGLPKPLEVDGPRAQGLEGQVVGSEQLVRETMHRCKMPQDRLHIVRGWFQDTFPTVTIGKIAFFHIDADWYESVKLCLDRFYDHLEPGAVVILDDYMDWPGCKKAFEDFNSERNLNIVPFEGTLQVPPHFRKPGAQAT